MSLEENNEAAATAVATEEATPAAAAAATLESDSDLLERVEGLVREAARRSADEGVSIDDSRDGKETTQWLEGFFRRRDETTSSSNKRPRLVLTERQRYIIDLAGKVAQERIRALNARRHSEEAKQRHEDLARQLLDITSLSDGTYYASVDRVWRATPMSYADPHLFQALRRDKAPTFVSRSIAPITAAPSKAAEASFTVDACDENSAAAGVELCGEDVYAKTLSCATHPDYEAVADDGTPRKQSPPHPDPPAKSSSRGASDDDDDQSSVVWQSSEASSSHPTYSSEVKNLIWGAAVWAHRCPHDRIVSLIPKCPDKAALYYDVATCALGLKDGEDDNNEATWETLQKSIFGSRKKKQEGSDNCDAWVVGSGLKKIVPNKVRISFGDHYFDKRPCLLVVPVMDLDSMKSWSGEAYKAIVLPGAWTEPHNLVLLETICRSTFLNEIEDTASPAQIEQARSLLEGVVLGLAHSLHYRLAKLESNLTSTQKKMLHRRRDGFRTIPGAPESVYVPETFSSHTAATSSAAPATASSTSVLPSSAGDATKTKKSTDEAAADAGSSTQLPSSASTPLRVRLVEFQGATGEVGSDGATSGHPAPDPLLLAVRAAVNWSWRNHQKVLESGEPDPPEHPLDILATEQYLAWRDQAARARTREDVAAGLGQPNGYQGNDGDDNENEDGGGGGGVEGDKDYGDDEVDEVDYYYDSVP